MKFTKTRVVSLRVPMSEFVELAAEAEARNLTVAAVLLAGWRERKAQQPIEVLLRKIEMQVGEWRAENSERFQKVRDAVNTLARRIP